MKIKKEPSFKSSDESISDTDSGLGFDTNMSGDEIDEANEYLGNSSKLSKKILTVVDPSTLDHSSNTDEQVTEVSIKNQKPVQDSSDEIKALQSYISMRVLEKERSRSRYNSFTARLFGLSYMSATIKLAAAKKLLQVCQDNRVEKSLFTPKELSVLKNTRLGKIFKNLASTENFPHCLQKKTIKVALV